MMKLLRNPQALYVSDLGDSSVGTPTASPLHSAKITITFSVLLVLLFTAFFVPTSSVSADEEEPEKILTDQLGEYGSGNDFEAALDQYYGTDSETRGNDFGYLIERLFTLRYMNATLEGVAPEGFDEREYNCDVEAPGAGTPYYHNCDVPNIMTEFVQDVFAMFTNQGVVGGTVQSVTLSNSWFGLPSNIPNKGNVPVDEADRSDKYSALELYGYNLRYTNYAGEWDHIKVYTPARAMSNFGFMDGLRLGTRAILSGIKGGLDKAGENAARSLSQGDILGAIGGAWAGLVSGTTAATVNVVIDSSDLNVFNTNAWYRVGYGGTLYGARELSEDELANVAENSLLQALGDITGEDATLPEEFTQLKDPPPKPKEAISRCVVTKEDGSTENIDDESEDRCNDLAEEEGNESAEWTEDGAQKVETLVMWRDANKTWFEAAENYNLACEIDFEDESKRDDTIASFYSCHPQAYSDAAAEEGARLQEESFEELVSNSISAKFFLAALAANADTNYNAPWNRFICVDSNGADLLDESDGSSKVMLLDSEGNINEQCANVRPPIQDGLFGNGYPNADDVETDTRRAAYSTDPIDMLLNPSGMGTYYSNLNLGIASFATQVSNAILNLSFSPILSTLGVDDLIEDLIGDFRDSIFYPFTLFVIIGGAFMIFAGIVRSRAYREAFKSLALMVGVFIMGAIILYNPGLAMKVVDDVPAKVETAIMGTLFSIGNESGDELCTTTGNSGNAEEGLDGDTLSYAPEDSVRTMMCENWRAFLFNPWQYGQWGAPYSDLYAAGSGEDSTMNNTNGDLVGSASVNMGNGTTVQNWSLYQLEVMGSGTATTRDNTTGQGFTSGDMYRLVDLQAGPNNGAGTDDRYFEMWSGGDPAERAAASFMAAVVSIFGLVTMTVYGLTKVLIAFLSTFMLILLPLMFLLGMIPRVGFGKLRNYVGTIAGLMIQRIMLVVLLGIMIRMVSGITGATDTFVTSMLGAVIVCVGFLMFRTQIMDLIMRSTTSDQGGMAGLSSFKRMADKATPTSVRNYAQLQGRRASSAVSGAMGGFMVGGVAGAKKAAGDSVRQETNKLRNKQRTQGFGLGQSAGYAAESAAQSAVSELRQAPNKGIVNEKVQAQLEERVQSEVGKNVDPETIKGPRGQIQPDKMPKARDARIMSRLQKAEAALHKAEEKASAPIMPEKESTSQMRHPQARRIKHAQKKIAEINDTRAPAVEEAEERFNRSVDQAVGSEVRRQKRKAANSEFRDSLSNLRDQYKGNRNPKPEQLSGGNGTDNTSSDNDKNQEG